MNKAILVILLGMLVLAQASKMETLEVKSESQEEAQGQLQREPQEESNDRQLLIVFNNHEFYTFCMRSCLKRYSHSWCNTCCAVVFLAIAEANHPSTPSYHPIITNPTNLHFLRS